MRRSCPALAVVVLATALAWPAGMAAQSSPVAVKLGSLAPSGSVWHDVLMQMASTWKRVTSGRVVLNVYPGAQGDETSLVRKMEIGQFQAASLTMVGLVRIDDAFNVFGIPLFYQSHEELLHVVEKLTPVLQKRLADKHYVLLNWGYAGWAQVFSRSALGGIDDLKRVRIFTVAGDDRMVQWYKARGFNPQPLAVTDVMLSLQSGLVDALPSPPLAMLTFQWYKLAPHMLDIPLAPLVGATVVTERAWNRIPESDRQPLLDAARQAERRLAAEVPAQDRQAIAEMEKRGLKVTALRGTKQAATFEAAAKEYADSMRGLWVPPEIFDLAVRERDAFRAQRRGSH
jgi:TRAP-type transport system periplasmic protein